MTTHELHSGYTSGAYPLRRLVITSAETVWGDVVEWG